MERLIILLMIQNILMISMISKTYRTTIFNKSVFAHNFQSSISYEH